MWKWKINEEDCHVSKKWDRIPVCGNENYACVFKIPAKHLIFLTPGLLYSFSLLACLSEVFEFTSPCLHPLLFQLCSAFPWGKGCVSFAPFILPAQGSYPFTWIMPQCLCISLLGGGGPMGRSRRYLSPFLALGHLFHITASLPLTAKLQGSCPF